MSVLTKTKRLIKWTY